MAIKSSSYGTCQQCKALNMAHRTTCYRCGTAITPTASRGLNGQSAAQTQYQPPRMDRRNFRRHDVSFSGAVLKADGTIEYPILVRNVGVGGLLFDCARQYHLNDTLTVQVEMEGETY